MYILELRVTVPPGKERAVRREAQRLLGPTRARPGCLDCRCLRDTESDTTLILTEQWDSREHLESHVRSDDFRVMLGLMDLATETPGVRIHEVSSTSGLDELAKIRG